MLVCIVFFITFSEVRFLIKMNPCLDRKQPQRGGMFIERDGNSPPLPKPQRGDTHRRADCRRSDRIAWKGLVKRNRLCTN